MMGSDMVVTYQEKGLGVVADNSFLLFCLFNTFSSCSSLEELRIAYMVLPHTVSPQQCWVSLRGSDWTRATQWLSWSSEDLNPGLPIPSPALSNRQRVFLVNSKRKGRGGGNIALLIWLCIRFVNSSHKLICVDELCMQLNLGSGTYMPIKILYM